MKENIIGHKIIMRAQLKLNNITLMFILEPLIKIRGTNNDYSDNFELYFTKINGEIVLKLVELGVEEQIIKWEEYMKYRMMILDESRIKLCKEIFPKSYKEFYDNNSWNSKHITFKDFVPYAKPFDEILKDNSIYLKEREQLKFWIFGYDWILPLNSKDFKGLKEIGENL